MTLSTEQIAEAMHAAMQLPEEHRTAAIQAIFAPDSGNGNGNGSVPADKPAKGSHKGKGKGKGRKSSRARNGARKPRDPKAHATHVKAEGWSMGEVEEKLRSTKIGGEILKQATVYPVGDWLWCEFSAKPDRKFTEQLYLWGFHWSRKRSAWQHPCGVKARGRSPRDPREQYEVGDPI